MYKMEENAKAPDLLMDGIARDAGLKTGPVLFKLQGGEIAIHDYL